MYASIEIKLVFSQEINGGCLAEKLIRWAINWKLLARKYVKIVPVKGDQSQNDIYEKANRKPMSQRRMLF